jgi:hypothetical protein
VNFNGHKGSLASVRTFASEHEKPFILSAFKSASARWHDSSTTVVEDGGSNGAEQAASNSPGNHFTGPPARPASAYVPIPQRSQQA